jgi:hypothetical protein
MESLVLNVRRIVRKIAKKNDCNMSMANVTVVASQVFNISGRKVSIPNRFIMQIDGSLK